MVRLLRQHGVGGSARQLRPHLSVDPRRTAVYGRHAAQEVWDSGGKKAFPEDCFCYRWQIWVNAMFLTRNSADDMSLAYGPPKDGEVTNADEMDFGFRWGPQLGAYYYCNECTSIGTEFYFIDGWNASGVTTGDISVQFPSLVHLPVANDGAPLTTTRHGCTTSNSTPRRTTSGSPCWRAFAGSNCLKTSPPPSQRAGTR